MAVAVMVRKAEPPGRPAQSHPGVTTCCNYILIAALGFHRSAPSAASSGRTLSDRLETSQLVTAVAAVTAELVQLRHCRPSGELAVMVASICSR